MKKPEDCDEKELLIRIHERIQCLPDIKKKIDRHDVMIAVYGILLVLIVSKTFPALAELIVR